MSGVRKRRILFFCKSFCDTNALAKNNLAYRIFQHMFRALHSPQLCVVVAFIFGDLPCSRARSGVGPSADTEGWEALPAPVEASGCPYEAAASAGQPLRTRGPPSSALFSTRRCSLSLPLPLRWRTTPRSRRSSGLRSRRAPSPRSRSSTRQLASRRAWPTSRCAAHAPRTASRPPARLLQRLSPSSPSAPRALTGSHCDRLTSGRLPVVGQVRLWSDRQGGAVER